MIDLKKYNLWFITGSQHLYGNEILKEVEEHSKEIVGTLNESGEIPVNIVYKNILTTPDSVYKLCLEANNAENCIGIVAWMHTFSPAKMWINGLKILQKPLLHLHTQYNRDIPWSEIDMDFMNLNQSAHGGREFGFICTRMGINRKVVVGHWKNENVRKKIAVWARATAGWANAQTAKIARFGDNMREVAVTEGDKVEAQLKLGYSVNGYGVGDLVNYVNEVDDKSVDHLIDQYSEIYEFAGDVKEGSEYYQSVKDAAKIELGLRAFLEEGNFQGFTTTFEDLHGLKQLPGLSVQRLMADGYGFGAEGDWKTAALLRSMKVMASGLQGGTSFMEDYTYHFDPSGNQVLGAHMLEICPTVASEKPKLEVHPLSIGGKEDPARLVFNSPAGPAINASLVDMGNRFRMIVNKVEAVKPEAELPKLPVARVMWKPKPNLEIAAAAWIYAGGAHHTGYSQALTAEHIEDYCEMAGIEYLLIDENTNIREFKSELRASSLYYQK